MEWQPLYLQSLNYSSHISPFSDLSPEASRRGDMVTGIGGPCRVKPHVCNLWGSPHIPNVALCSCGLCESQGKTRPTLSLRLDRSRAIRPAGRQSVSGFLLS
jgi:hypothetical protein